MFRAIPEVSRICSMQERSLKYKQHLDALNRIRAKPSDLGPKPLNRTRARSYNDTLRGKARREELARINYENQKMKHAIVYRPSSINRADFKAHELDHEYQVQRLTGNAYSYGFQPTKHKRYHSSLNQTLEPMPSETKPKDTPTEEVTEPEKDVSEPIKSPPKQNETTKKPSSSKPKEEPPKPVVKEETFEYTAPSNPEPKEEIEIKDESQETPEPEKDKENQAQDDGLNMIDIKGVLTGNAKA